ncbi:hypothetical protein D3C78_1306540 [compost metagenome]
MLLPLRRAINHIAATCEAGQQLGNLFGGVLQIIIQSDDNFASGMANPCQQRVVLPVIPAHAQTMNTPIDQRQSTDHIP